MSEKKVKITPQITVKEFASRLNLPVSDLIKQLMQNGIFASINDFIDYDTAFIVAEELGFSPEPDTQVATTDEMTFEKLLEIINLEATNKETLTKRPPVVTILGHVDHGKTTLLDTLRKTHVAEGEAGGITQHIRAYQIKKKGRLITFIDTPGHEAFQAMRQRGALAADIAILVVAADDGIKPQTKEVATFILEHKIPFLVAINKIDKPSANIQKVKQQLSEIGIFIEGYGGEVPACEISAKNNLGLDELLETILLIADVQDFRGDIKRGALGIVLEAHKDSQKGPVATVLIKTGTLARNDQVSVGKIIGKIRKIEDYQGKNLEKALPSCPVTIYGLPSVPQSNDILSVEDNREKLKIKKKRMSVLRSLTSEIKTISSRQMIGAIDEKLKNKLPLVIKADVQGSLEAVVQILESLPSEEIKIDIVKKAVGPITESDIKVANTGKAIVYGFGVAPTSVASRIAQENGVPIKVFSVVYQLIEDIKNELSELLPPEIKKTELGRLKVMAVFKSNKHGMVVGGRVMSGVLKKGEQLEILRKGEVIGNGKLIQLQHNKDDVSEVKEGLECGITFDGKEKIEIDDILSCYQEEKIKRKI